MRIAFISDIHGNLEALKTVLRDIDDHGGADLFCCNGDLVGYYAHPRESISLVRETCGKGVIVGNHDEVVRVNGQEEFENEIEWFNHIARKALVWTRNELLDTEQMQYLRALPIQKEITAESKKILLVHGTPEEKWEYFIVYQGPGGLIAEQKTRMRGWLKKWDMVIFGHTHIAFSYKFRGRYVINPGSVGQPRDGDPRASYAIVDITDTDIKAQLKRVDYSIENTCNSLAKVDLDDYLCQRLYNGR
ncbi:MAG: metallophosphoesterase family protein [Candidatus Heimdallarchaeota archaeon]